MGHYTRNPEELRSVTSLYWPEALVQEEAESSVVPLLIETQDKFISLLDISDRAPDSWKVTLQASESFHANLFLKHLMVLSDIAGEKLQKLRFNELFPSDTMTFVWHDQIHEYQFKAITKTKKVGNKYLLVDGSGLSKPQPLSEKIEDIVMFILYGASAINTDLPTEMNEKCIIGTLIGRHEELAKFVRQRYIWVSRITGGAKSNKLGQIAQKFVLDTLKNELPDWSLKSGSIPGISHNAGRSLTKFDIVAMSPSDKFCAIEVCFQVTTNSVIERKQGQAEARAALLRNKGHKIAYVIDGIGNFERISALRTICQYSDCTVALSVDEIKILAQFLRDFDLGNLS